MRTPRQVGVTMVVFVVAALLSGCAAGSNPADPIPSAPAAGSSSRVELPPSGGQFSYQLGGAYQPPAGTRIVDRDRSAAPAPGIYSICYVNAFQAQTAEVRQEQGLLLRRTDGAVVEDEQWHEPLFDISTPAKRRTLIGVVGSWIDDCARRGYRAVEPDNLDSYTRSKGLLDADDALAFASELAARAHSDGLAIAQKNAADLSVAARRAGLDFAIAEECQVYQECGAYTDVYGAHLIEVEYTDQPLSAFRQACQQRGNQVSVVLRDRDVAPAGDPDHVERWCRRG